MSREKKPEVIVITGASAGVGRATVRAFAARGAHIGLVARGREGLEAARREVEDAGGSALVIPTDVADPDAVEAAADAVERAFGPIDIWVNCAMTSVLSSVVDMKPEEFRRVMEVNYLGYVHGTLAALKRMRPRDRGKIVQVSSALAFRGIPLQSAYCASKHAIVGFTESLITELIDEKSKVSISMVHMPGLNTPQFEWVECRVPNLPQPMPPFFAPEVAADAIVWAAHHERRDLRVGMPTVKTIVGNKIAPRLLDRFLGKKAIAKQQTSKPLDPNRPTNLWQPVAGDHGARGPFVDRAKRSSGQLWATTHRGTLALLALIVAGAGAATVARTRPSLIARTLRAIT